MKVAQKGDIWWVAAFVAVLAFSMIVPSWRSRRYTIMDQCWHRVYRIGLSLEMYRYYHGARASPEGASDFPWEDKRTFLCPVKRRGGLAGTGVVEGWGDYVYVGDQIESVPPEQLGRTPILFDKAGNHPDGTRTVLFADGHIEVLSEEEFGRLMGTTVALPPATPTVPLPSAE